MSRVEQITAIDQGNAWLNYQIHVNTGRVFLPAHEAYSEIRILNGVEDHKYLLLMIPHLEELKKKYSSIYFKLLPDFYDIRPFTWKGFLVRKRYTYIADLLTANFSDKTERKFLRKGYSIVKSEINHDSLDKHIEFLKGEIPAYRLRNIRKEINQHKSNLKEYKIIDAEGVIQASHIVSFSRDHSTAYDLLYMQNEQFGSERGAKFAYLELMKLLRIEGFIRFDLCGANMKGIADFKSGLPVMLTPYYEVFYEKNIFRRWIRKILSHNI